MTEQYTAVRRGTRPDIHRSRHDIVGRRLGGWLIALGLLLVTYFYISTPEGQTLLPAPLADSVRMVITWLSFAAGAGVVIMTVYYLVCLALDREDVYEAPHKERSLSGIDLTMFSAKPHSDGTAIVVRALAACGVVGAIGAGSMYYGYVMADADFIRAASSVVVTIAVLICAYSAYVLSRTHRRHSSEQFARFLSRNTIRQLPPGQHPTLRSDIQASDSQYVAGFSEARIETALSGTYNGQPYTLSVLDVSGYGRSGRWVTMAQLPYEAPYTPERTLKVEATLRDKLHTLGVATVERGDKALYLFWENGLEFSQPGLVALYEPIDYAARTLQKLQKKR